MVTLRSSRLEGILGSGLDALAVEHLQGLVNGRVPESFDLDYKSKNYGGSDSERRDLAGDVAALANTAGGLLLIGVEEDDQARASGLAPVEISDDVRRRVLQVVSSLVSPLPTFDVELIHADNGEGASGLGYIAIAVQRSLAAPHAVLVNEGLRYPKRNGTTTRYLSEAEVAAAYRDRIYAAAERADRANIIGAELMGRLSASSPWLVVTVIPDIPGQFDIDLTAVEELRSKPMRNSLFSRNAFAPTVRTGRSRLVAQVDFKDDEISEWGVMEFHRDGSGAWAHPLSTKSFQTFPDESPVLILNDEVVVEATLTGLSVLGDHARNRAGAGGNVLVRVSIWWAPELGPLALGHFRNHGFGEKIGGTRTLDKAPPAIESTATLDSIGEIGPALVASAYDPLQELLQSFGMAEPLQISREGALRRRYFARSNQESFTQTVAELGLPLTDATVT